jgi:tyrosyl-tRNA synthetase
MDFIDEAKARGFFSQCTDEDSLRKIMRDGQIRGYIGFDATADSLHVGSLVQIMMLRLFQRHGHIPHVVIGGATTRIGDPSFRDTTRPPITPEQITINERGIIDTIDQFFNGDYYLDNNFSWFKDINYLDFMANTGPYFSVNRMMSFDSVKSRLEREQGLSLLEFQYAVMQSYDFRMMRQKYGMHFVLQMGGSDQWGNIVSGIDYIKKIEQRTVYGLTAPLLTMANGEKMGKSAGGAVWLSADKLSPYEYWQFWRNTPDADTFRFLKLFTELDLHHISELEDCLKGSEINVAKIMLANEATTIAHGLKESQKALQTSRDTFHGSGTNEDLPKYEVSKKEFDNGVSITTLLFQSGLAKSRSDARRLIAGGGAKVNDVVVTDDAMLITSPVKLSAGKKKHVLIRANENV